MGAIVAQKLRVREIWGTLVQAAQRVVGVVVADVDGLGKSSRSVGINAPETSHWENDLGNRGDGMEKWST